MSYSGSFVVTNSTGNTITNVSVTHTCASYTNVASASSLAPGASIPYTAMTAQSGSNDYWSITFTLNGQVYSRSKKQCNYMPSDSPQGVVIALYVKNWSIILPVTASCLNNYYSTPSLATASAESCETCGGVKEA